MSGVVAAIAASGLGGLGLRLSPLFVVLWLGLVAGLAARSQGARIALIMYGVLVAVLIALSAGRFEIGPLTLLVALILQTAGLFMPSLKKSWT